MSALHGPVLAWYADHARDLPWRRPGTSPWAVLVSEVMLQQTPVARVLPAWAGWLERWPTAAALAAAPPGEAVRQWGRLGYPRRALRLHQTARVVVERHAGAVPSTYDDLRALPGVGAYTAAAVAVFAHGQRHPVLDTNVRRVLARAVGGVQRPPPVPDAAETERAAALLPADAALAARWSVALMEFGALVCTARRPRCPQCPVQTSCAWRIAGSPDAGRPRAGQPFAGTDRQARGRLLEVLRQAAGAASAEAVAAAWPEPVQRERALNGLIADGLAEPVAGGGFQLPRTSPPVVGALPGD